MHIVHLFTKFSREKIHRTITGPARYSLDQFDHNQHILDKSIFCFIFACERCLSFADIAEQIRFIFDALALWRHDNDAINFQNDHENVTNIETHSLVFTSFNQEG